MCRDGGYKLDEKDEIVGPALVAYQGNNRLKV
jgi:hypothetical protein